MSGGDFPLVFFTGEPPWLSRLRYNSFLRNTFDTVLPRTMLAIKATAQQLSTLPSLYAKLLTDLRLFGVRVVFVKQTHVPTILVRQGLSWLRRVNRGQLRWLPHRYRCWRDWDRRRRIALRWVRPKARPRNLGRLLRRYYQVRKMARKAVMRMIVVHRVRNRRRSHAEGL